MGVSVQDADGVSVVTADCANSEAAACELRDVLRGLSTPYVVIDFGELDVIDSGHLALLLAYARDAGASRRAALVVSGRALDALQDWRIDDHIGIYRERAAALADVAKVV